MLPYDPVGLDLSLTSTGIATGNSTWAINAKGLKGPQRLIHLRDEIIEALEQQSDELHSANGVLVLVEGYSFGSRNSHAHALGELGGVVRVALHEAGFPYVEVPPTVRAKFATGRGNAGKSEVVSAVSARTGLLWDGAGNEDRCDAWILQEIGYTFLGEPRFEWPASHRSALTKIEWPLIVTLNQEGVDYGN
jgi:crossover junction endodeoxyribonuclease RuvC